MFLIDGAIWYCFFLIAMGKMLVHDTTPYMGSDTPERVYHKKLVFGSAFLVLSCLLLSLISKGAPLAFRLFWAALTAYNYHKLICLGCRKRTMDRYANLLTMVLVIFAADNFCLWAAALIIGLVISSNRVHQEYLTAGAKWNSGPVMCTAAQQAYRAAAATRQPHRAAYCHDEGAEEDEEWGSWQDEEEEDTQWQEDDSYDDNRWDNDEANSCDYSSWDSIEDDSSGWGYADNPNTMDYANTDWNSYDYSSNPEVAVTIMDMMC